MNEPKLCDVCGAAIPGAGRIVVAAVVEVDLAEAPPRLSLVVRHRYVQGVTSTIYAFTFVARRHFAVIPADHQPAVLMPHDVWRAGRRIESAGNCLGPGAAVVFRIRLVEEPRLGPH